MARSVGLVILLLELVLFSEVGADRYAGVCRVCKESMAGKHCIGTAFIVRGSDEKLKAVTNAHVLEDEEDARGAELQCGFLGDRVVTLDPDSFFWTSPTSAADTTVVAVSGSPNVAPMTVSTAPPQQGRAIQIWGFGGGKDLGTPGGEVKSTEFHNHFYFIHDAVTEGGHSGSPIMMKENGAWIVVGLHRQGSAEGGFGGGTMTSELRGLPELQSVFAEPTSEAAPTPAPPRPTAAPTPHPTVAPTPAPARPTAAPTPHPTVAPTPAPPRPTAAPTPHPTVAPTPTPARPTAATSDDSANVTSNGSAGGDKAATSDDGDNVIFDGSIFNGSALRVKVENSLEGNWEKIWVVLGLGAAFVIGYLLSFIFNFRYMYYQIVECFQEMCISGYQRLTSSC